MIVRLFHLPPQFTEQDVAELWRERGIDVPIVTIDFEEGDGTRPVAMVRLQCDEPTLKAVTKTLDGALWKGHVIHASHLVMFK